MPQLSTGSQSPSLSSNPQLVPSWVETTINCRVSGRHSNAFLFTLVHILILITGHTCLGDERGEFVFKKVNAWWIKPKEIFTDCLQSVAWQNQWSYLPAKIIFSIGLRVTKSPVRVGRNARQWTDRGNSPHEDEEDMTCSALKHCYYTCWWTRINFKDTVDDVRLNEWGNIDLNQQQQDSLKTSIQNLFLCVFDQTWNPR